MIERRDSWLQRNWILLWATSCFLFALLRAWKWFEFRAQDAVLEAVFNLIVGVAFLSLHRSRKSEESFRGAQKQLTDALENKK